MNKTRRGPPRARPITGCSRFYEGDCVGSDFIDNCQNYTTMKGGKMKRYKIADGMWIEDPEGEWVKWEDSRIEIRRITDIYETRIKELKAKIGQECNCEEMANKPDYENHPDGLSPMPILLPPFWICPAHGYKRR